MRVHCGDLHSYEELSADGTHRHIEGVCTSAGTHYTRQEVVDSINAGNTWKTSADGYEATIATMAYCVYGLDNEPPPVLTRC